MGRQKISEKLTVNMVGLPAVEELFRVLRSERDAAQAEAAKYKALWDSVPRDAIRTAAAFALVDPYFAGGPPDPIEFQVRIVEGWLADHAPEPQDKEPQP